MDLGFSRPIASCTWFGIEVDIIGPNTNAFVRGTLADKNVASRVNTDAVRFMMLKLILGEYSEKGGSITN